LFTYLFNEAQGITKASQKADRSKKIRIAPMMILLAANVQAVCLEGTHICRFINPQVQTGYQKKRTELFKQNRWFFVN